MQWVREKIREGGERVPLRNEIRRLGMGQRNPASNFFFQRQAYIFRGGPLNGQSLLINFLEGLVNLLYP